MSDVTFKFPLGIKVKCTLTGFHGTIAARSEIFSGSIMYSVQPRMKSEDSGYVPEAYALDEVQLVPEEEGRTFEPETVNFKLELGDKVKNRINGFEGIVTARKQHLNKCVNYIIETRYDDKEKKEVMNGAFEAKLEKVSDGLNAAQEAPIERKKTGGPILRERMIEVG